MNDRDLLENAAAALSRYAEKSGEPGCYQKYIDLLRGVAPQLPGDSPADSRSLREEFVKAAMQGLCAAQDPLRWQESTARVISDHAIWVARETIAAMEAARE